MQWQDNAMVGKSFDRWTVVAFSHIKGPHRYYVCRCSCGNEKTIQAVSLNAGTSKSCGCLRVDRSREIHTTHGQVKHPAYGSWGAMRRRCEDPRCVAFRWYGAKGIRVVAEWHTFDGFWRDMGPTWEPGLTIDRINPRGNYEPINCRWITMKAQAANRTSTRFIETPWGSLPQAQAAAKAGISVGALVHRIKAGWPKERWFEPAERK